MATIPNDLKLLKSVEWTPEQSKLIIEFAKKISGLGIKAQFKRVEAGPIITGYYFTLDASQPISKILNKPEDFALAAHVDKVTIERQGGEVVIFVPNENRTVIQFQDALYWLAGQQKTSKMELPILLGVDHIGNKSAIDLADMPHILIAGSTGAGKSVLETAIVSTLAVLLAPSEMQIYLVDTKRVDLTLFENLTHVRKIVRDLEDFHIVGSQIMNEARARMRMLEISKVRNIKEFHNKGNALPYIVIVIDELADIIEQDRQFYKGLEKDEKKDYVTVEKWLQQLTQVCRATGIHVIAATQRPSVKIISGDVKANFPCRIALRLPTEFDSRTILGEGGAENLLGKGDMLAQLPEEAALKRFHGPYVQLEDIKHIIEQHEQLRLMFEVIRNN